VEVEKGGRIQMIIQLLPFVALALDVAVWLYKRKKERKT